MPSSLATTLSEIIGNGLRRKSIIDCATWAEKCRIVGKPFPGAYSFKYFPWCRELHNNNSTKIVGMKAAQVGFTEYALNRTFYTLDIKRVDCLYLLPSQTPDASNFSAGRFDPALELSPYLNGLFSNVKNVGHKRAGSTNLYIRGTRSRSQLKSIPAGLIVFDELDEMTQKNLSLAEERQSGQMYYQQIKISTPTVAGRGISEEFKDSDQRHFQFKCPHCSRFTEFVYPDCLVITANSIYDNSINDSHIICKECKTPLSHETKFEYLASGVWVPSNNNAYPGYHINGFYASADARKPAAIATKVLNSKDDPIEEQELFNSILGSVHEVKGARLTDSDITQCIKDYALRPNIGYSSITTLGIDVGTPNCYYEVDQWLPIPNDNQALLLKEESNNSDINMLYRPKVVDLGILTNFNDFDILMRKWQIRSCVIDAHPDKRSSLEFASRFQGFVRLCVYVEGIKSRNCTEWSDEPVISVDRTAWFDLSLGRFKKRTILLPHNLDNINFNLSGESNNGNYGSYRKHLKELIRKPERDKFGNPTARYVTGDNIPDHFAHARNYSEIALPFAINMGKTQNIISPR